MTKKIMIDDFTCNNKAIKFYLRFYFLNKSILKIFRMKLNMNTNELSMKNV